MEQGNGRRRFVGLGRRARRENLCLIFIPTSQNDNLSTISERTTAKARRGAAQPRRRKQAERRTETRQQLLRAAGRVFAARGYYGSTLDDIAREAGLSKGSVYYNFESKEDLFLRLLSARIADRLDEVGMLLGQPTVDAPAAGTAFVRRIERDPRWTPLFFEFVALSARSPAVRERFAEWMVETRGRIAQLIEARFAGQTLALDPAELATVVSALANGILIERIFDRDGVREDLLADALAALAAGAIRPSGGTSR